MINDNYVDYLDTTIFKNQCDPTRLLAKVYFKPTDHHQLLHVHKQSFHPKHTFKGILKSCIITYTGHDRRLYNQDRSRPTTLYTFCTIMQQSSSEYTKNTRSCIITYTGHYRRLYKRLTQLSGLRSTGVGI